MTERRTAVILPFTPRSPAPGPLRVVPCDVIIVRFGQRPKWPGGIDDLAINEWFDFWRAWWGL
jgi:hypothetical protein